jgi:hypothetical protein
VAIIIKYFLPSSIDRFNINKYELNENVFECVATIMKTTKYSRLVRTVTLSTHFHYFMIGLAVNIE